MPAVLSIRESVAFTRSAAESAGLVEAIVGSSSGGGATLLFAEPVADTSFSARGWYDNASPARSTVSPPAGSTGSILYAWTAGQSVPASGAASRVIFTDSDELFIRFKVRFNTGWRGSGVDYHPHLVQIGCTDDDPFFAVAKSFMEAYLDFVYFAGLGGTRCEFALQDSENIRTDSLGSIPATTPEDRAVSGYNGQQGDASPGRWDTYDNGGADYRNYRVLYPSGGIIATDDASWFEFALYMKCNTVTSGVANIDGQMRLWRDGTLIRSSDELLFRSGAYATRKFNQLILAPYIQPGSGSPITQSLNITAIELYDTAPAGYSIGGGTAFTRAIAEAGTATDVVARVYSGETDILFDSAITPSLIDNRTWESLLSDLPGTDWSFDGSRGTLVGVVDSEFPEPSAVCLDVIYPFDHASGGSPGQIERNLPAATKLYWREYIKLSDNWVGEPSGTNKYGFVWVSYSGAGEGPGFILSARGAGAGTLICTPQIQTNAWTVPGISGGEYFIPNLGPSGEMVRGQVHKFECLIQLNTGTASNGRFRFALDNVLIGDYPSCKLADNPTGFPYFEHQNTWGGNSLGVTTGVEIFQRFGRLVIYGGT